MPRILHNLPMRCSASLMFEPKPLVKLTFPLRVTHARGGKGSRVMTSHVTDNMAEINETRDTQVRSLQLRSLFGRFHKRRDCNRPRPSGRYIA